MKLKPFRGTDKEPLLFFERALLAPPPIEEHMLAQMPPVAVDRFGDAVSPLERVTGHAAALVSAGDGLTGKVTAGGVPAVL